MTGDYIFKYNKCLNKLFVGRLHKIYVVLGVGFEFSFDVF